MPDTETILSTVKHRLRFAQSLDLRKDRSHSLHVVRADGRGAQLQVPADWTSLWIALSGPLEMESPWCAWRLEPGRMLLWTDGHLRASSRMPAWWLVVAAPTQRWSAWRADRPGCRAAELIPWEARCRRDLKRTVVRMARRTSDSGAGTMMLVETLVAQLLEQQRASVQTWLAKCSGRTLQRKQQSLLRLLRVQKIVSTNPEARLDLASLARYANYSPHHLIRVYRNVFGETPAECALRLRTRLA